MVVYTDQIQLQIRNFLGNMYGYYRIGHGSQTGVVYRQGTYESYLMFEIVDFF